jgi:hypothetical protein
MADRTKPPATAVMVAPNLPPRAGADGEACSMNVADGLLSPLGIKCHGAG